MSNLIVWHDGGCPLCRREIALMRRLDRRGSIQFIDVTTAQEAACPIDPAVLLMRFHASEDGVLLSGAAAFAAMWRAIPLLRPLGFVTAPFCGSARGCSAGSRRVLHKAGPRHRRRRRRVVLRTKPDRVSCVITVDQPPLAVGAYPRNPGSPCSIVRSP